MAQQDSHNPFGHTGATAPGSPLVPMNSAARTSADASPAVRSPATPVPFYNVAQGQPPPRMGAHAAIHTVSPVYTGRAVGGFLSEISRSKTLQDYVNDWVQSGLMLLQLHNGEDFTKAVKQPSAASPFTILRFYMGTIVAPPARWGVTTADATLLSVATLRQFVLHRQYGRLKELIPSPASLRDRFPMLISVKTINITEFTEQTSHFLALCRARIASLIATKSVLLAADEVKQVLDSLLGMFVEAEKSDPDAIPLIRFAICKWLIVYADAMASAGSKRHACSILSTLLASVAGKDAPWSPCLGELDYVPSLDTQHAYLADYAQSGKEAILARLQKGCVTDETLSTPVRCFAAVQNSLAFTKDVGVSCIIDAGVRLLHVLAELGTHDAARRVCLNLSRLSGVDIDDSGPATLQSFFAFSGSALPTTAQHRWILKGLPLYYSAMYFATYGPLDLLSRAVQELAAIPHWADGLLASTMTIGDISSPVGTDVAGGEMSPAKSSTTNLASALSQTLRAYICIQKRDYDGAQRAGEAAVDVATELYSNWAPSADPSTVEFDEPVIVSAREVLWNACLGLCAASAKKSNPVTCGFVVLDALLRSSPTTFAHPSIIAAYSGLMEQSGDAAGANRTKKVLQAVCSAYGLDYLDAALFRLPEG